MPKLAVLARGADLEGAAFRVVAGPLAWDPYRQTVFMQQQQTGYAWQFFRAGGVEQVAIRTGQDIANIASLDKKLWVALACPTRGIEFDTETLDMIDQDHDGRIRAPELVAACQWAVAQLRDPEVLVSGSDVLQLGSINTEQADGAALHAEALRVLSLLGREGADSVSLADVRERLAQLNALAFNGDGLLNPATLPADCEQQALVQRIMDLYGSEVGVDGAPGMGQAQLDAFFADVRAIQSWYAGTQDSSCTLAQEQAVAAAQALTAIEAKVEDFFARCRLAAFDAKAQDPLNPSVEGYAALGAQQLSSTSEAIAALPLATITPEGVLPLAEGVNPAWAGALQALAEHAVAPLLGAQQQLSAAQWQTLKAQLAPCQQWLAGHPVSPLGQMELAEVQALLDGGAEAALQALIARDNQEKDHGALAAQLEKLIRLQRDLLRLLNNFVSFSDFYSRREAAAFQAGTLYMDGRSCDLTVDVTDPNAHAGLAGLAKVYLAYCECRRDGVKRHIVAAFTAGDVDYLMVGRNGVFYDRDGQDWDATITKIIENPTSIGQAFFSPYKKFLRMVEEQVAKRASAKQDAVTVKLDASANKLADTAQGEPAPAAAAAPARKTDVGTVAAIGVALGSISAVMVGIFAKFIELGPWIPVGLLGIVLAISCPSMLIAWLKLRQRSLGPILDASGWAINGRMIINLRLGDALSQTAKVPASAKLSASDPYADNHRGRWITIGVLVVVLALAGAWQKQWLDKLLPAKFQRAAVPATVVPAVEAPAPTAEAPAAPAAPAPAQ
jgi:hypothetical protein